MELSDNERAILETLRDGAYSTVSQVAVAAGLSYTLTQISMRKLARCALISGYELTLGGHKALEGEPLKESDLPEHVNIRHVL